MPYCLAALLRSFLQSQAFFLVQPIAGYNIYQSAIGGSSYQLLSLVGSTELTYTDGSNVQGGETYDSIIESVDSSGAESIPSNVASVTIP